MTKEQIKQLEADILQSNQGQLDSEEVSGTFEMALVIIKELQEELRQYQPQPIETAPKDGTEILTLIVDKWNQNGDRNQPKVSYEYNVASWKHYEWFVAEKGEDYEYQKITIKPTHWMPLPEFNQQND
jgi:hypothetical protein